MREPQADSPADRTPMPTSRREARELAQSSRRRRTRPAHATAHHGTATHATETVLRTRREARELATRHRRGARRTAAGSALLRMTAPVLAAAVVAAGVVALPDRVSAGTPVVQDVEVAGSDSWLTEASRVTTGRGSSVASRSTTPRFTLMQGVTAAAEGQRTMATRVAALNTSLDAAVETTEGARNQAREFATAHAFHEPVLGAHQTSSFGWRWGRMHNGLDYGAAHGSPLYSVGRGTVTTAGWNSGLGYHVKIALDTGELIVYGHLSQIDISTGDPVDAGTPLGNVGNTGRSTGAHLHFEVRTDDGPIDPAPWLSARRG